MSDEEYKLAVALESKGADRVQDDLESTERQFEDTTSSVDDSAQEFQGLSQYWQGATGAIVGALAAVSAGVLSRVPVIREAAVGLSSVVDSLALKVDETFRPALSKVNEKLFSLSEAIGETDGPLETLIGAVTGLAAGGFAVAGALAVAEVVLSSLASTLVGGALIGAVKSIASALVSFVSGSLAAAAAFGALLGLLGVGILEKTGILDAVRNLGAAIGEALPAAVRDGMLAVLSLVLGPLAVIGAAISGFVKGFLEGGLSEGISRAVERAKEALSIFTGAWDRILSGVGDIIGDFIEQAFNFGRKLIEEFVSGIMSMRDDVADAAGDIAGEARAHLPGSPADKGPLSDLDETGPAFAETFAAGMAGGIGRVRSSAIQVAGAADDGSDDSSNVRVSTSAPPVYLDGREISRSTGRLGRDDTAKRGL